MAFKYLLYPFAALFIVYDSIQFKLQKRKLVKQLGANPFKDV